MSGNFGRALQTHLQILYFRDLPLQQQCNPVVRYLLYDEFWNNLEEKRNEDVHLVETAVQCTAPEDLWRQVVTEYSCLKLKDNGLHFNIRQSSASKG